MGIAQKPLCWRSVTYLAFALGQLTLPVPATATTAIERSLPELVQRAEVIAIGVVTHIYEHRDPERQTPFTLVTFSNLTVLKGTLGAELTLSFLGGRILDGQILKLSGLPRFTVGEKVIVFCAGNQRDIIPLVGLWQGLLRVRFDPQRKTEIVLNHSHTPILGIREGRFLTLTPEEAARAAGAAQLKLLSLSALQQLIQRELRRSDGQP
jgi:hypothetical protein